MSDRSDKTVCCTLDGTKTVCPVKPCSAPFGSERIFMKRLIFETSCISMFLMIAALQSLKLITEACNKKNSQSS